MGSVWLSASSLLADPTYHILGYAGPEAEQSRWCPEEQASWFSWIYLGFIDTLVEKGYQKPLKQEDLWSLPRTEETALQCRLFDAALASTKDPITAPQVMHCCILG